MTLNWSGKRRWIALVLVLASLVVMFNWPPVVPVIQLPGEIYPAGEVFGLPITNTFVGSMVVWIVILLLIRVVSSRRPRDGGEVPRGGFYNFFEMAFEGLYGFIGGIAPERYLGPIFKMFMTIFILVLLSNWLHLIPGIDSIGFLHPHVHKVDGHYELLDGFDLATLGGVHYLNGQCAWVSPEMAATMSDEALQARADAGCHSGIPAAAAADDHADEAAGDDHGEEIDYHHVEPGDPAVPWVILPYVRVPSTDLNMTLAFALIAVVMIQVMGFRALGIGYLTKFFNFSTLFKSPLGGIDVAVGLLELIGEMAKVLSFAFRLLGSMFAGSILLFVISFLLPVIAPWPVFLLEFFVGLIQAIVFGLLTAIFMSLATVSHHHDEEHHEEAAAGAH